MKKVVISKNTETTALLAELFFNKELSRRSERAVVVALEGDLGSGKTTFVQALARFMGVDVTVSSPTFVIQKTYDAKKVFKKIFHIDAYRLKTGSDLLLLRFEETIKDPDNLVLIEWPEIVRGVLPKDTKTITFRFVSHNEREVAF